MRFKFQFQYNKVFKNKTPIGLCYFVTVQQTIVKTRKFHQLLINIKLIC